MDENLHDIEDIFHSALNENEATPSQKAWEEIDKRLDKESVVSIKKKYTNLKRIAILLLLLLGISVYEMNRINNRNNLTENNKLASENKNKSAQSKDKILRESEGVTAKKSGDLENLNNSNNIYRENRLHADSFNNGNQKTGKEDNTAAYNKRDIPKKYTVQKLQSKNVNQKNKIVFNSSKHVRLASETFLKSKIKNYNPAEDTPLFTEHKNKREYQQIPYSQDQYTLDKNMILESKKVVDLKNSFKPLLASANRVPDTGTRHAVQNKTNNKQRISRFSIMPFFSPDIAWYRLKDANVNNQSGNAFDIQREETHEFSSTYGILADYKINTHWGSQSGITLSNINIVTEPEIIYAQPDNAGNVKYRVNTSSGYGYILPSYSANPVIGDSLFVFTSTHSLQYIGIPVSVTWSFVKNKFTIGAQAGVSANFLTKARLETTVEKGFDNSVETVNNIQGLKKIYLSGLAGIGVDFKLNKKISLAVAPTMRFALNSINKNAPVKSFPMSFGSAVGLKIKL